MPHFRDIAYKRYIITSRCVVPRRCARVHKKEKKKQTQHPFHRGDAFRSERLTLEVYYKMAPVSWEK